MSDEAEQAFSNYLNNDSAKEHFIGAAHQLQSGELTARDLRDLILHFFRAGRVSGQEVVIEAWKKTLPGAQQ